MTRLRPPRHEDAAAVAAVMCAADEADGGTPDTGTEDVLGYWRALDPAESALVAEEDGDLVAYADVIASSTDVQIDGYVHPSARGTGVGLELLRAAEELALRRRLGDVPIRAMIVSGAEEGARLLKQEGYAYVRSFFKMRVELAEKPPEPVWPTGLMPRPYVAGEDDATMHGTLTEAFADHWEPHVRSLEEWSRLNAQDPNLVAAASFIAYADDGEPTGAILSKRKYGGGWVEALGVRRPWRRSGLGLALLRAAFGALYDLGHRSIGLGVDAESTTGATRLYERAGMEVEVRYDTYEKRVP
jgi:mycothiol synthase